MDTLDYDYHYAEYARTIGIGDTESEDYVVRQAQQSHIYCVHDALRDEQGASITFAWKLPDPQARHFALYGVGRRISILWAALRGIMEAIPVGRTIPLTAEQVRAVSRDLNTIYINIVGAIDNYAWVLRYQLGSSEIKNLPVNRIGLFAKDFVNHACFASLVPLIASYKSWFNDLRTRRDPAAHQIPLYVPPTALKPEEVGRYREIESEIGALIPSAEFARIEELHLEQEKLGTFIPKFMHHPDEALIPFYPTIPQDLAQFMRVAAAVRHVITDSINATSPNT